MSPNYFQDAKPDRPEPKKKRRAVSYQHQKIIHQFLSAIATCPMDDELKTVLRMRVWGKDPKVFAPLSYLDISKLLKTRITNVKRWEEDGLWNVEQFLKRSGIGDIANKFHTDKGMKTLLVPKKRIIV